MNDARKADGTVRDDADTRGFTRRRLIKTGAVAGGLVWTAPAVKTVGRIGAPAGSPQPPPSTATTIDGETSTSTAGTSSTTVPTCDCSFCGTSVINGHTVVYMDCEPADAAECECLCNCGGHPEFPCSAPDPCHVVMDCRPRSEPCPV
jgi:hypothetical protein